LLQYLIPAANIDIRLKTFDNLLPIDGKLKLRLLLHLPEANKHAGVALLQFLCIDLEHLLDGCRMTAPLQRSPQHAHFFCQFLHFSSHSGEVVEAQAAQEVSAHDGDPLIHGFHEVSPHIVHLFERSPPQRIDIELRGVTLGHDAGDMVQFPLHFCPHLLDAADLGDDVGLPVQLEVLSDALGAQQLHALQTKMPQDFVRVRLAIRSGESGGVLADRTGSGEERS